MLGVDETSPLRRATPTETVLVDLENVAALFLRRQEKLSEEQEEYLWGGCATPSRRSPRRPEG